MSCCHKRLHLKHIILAIGSLLAGGVVPLWGERTAATTFWLWFPVIVSTFALLPMVRTLIFDACRSSMEIVSENSVTKASLVSFSILAPLNLANPINCLILFVKMSKCSLVYLTMVSFLYAVNASSVKASFSRVLICSTSL